MKNTNYPSGKQSVAIAAFTIFAMLIFMPVNLLLNSKIGESASFLVYYCLTMGTTFIIFYFLKKKNEGSVKLSFLPKDLIVVVLLILATLCLQWSVTIPLSDLIPMPDSVKELFRGLFEKMNDAYGLLAVAFAAPILEELVFRGIILDGLLKRRSAISAILISSFLFGVVHLNPWQFVSAMILGIFIGWVYLRTKNLIYCILIHFTNNFAASAMSFGDTEGAMMDMELHELYGGHDNMLIIISLSIGIAITCLYLLNKRMKDENLPDPNDIRLESHL